MLSKWLRDQAARTPGRRPYPIRLTPGQHAQLCAEYGGQHQDIFRTSLGYHPVQRVELPTRATGHNVILAPREDLFTESAEGIELVSLDNSVTNVPDNIACCEILSVGELVDNVKVGDLAFIDFYDVKQGYIVANDELYICGCEAFKGLWDAASGTIQPLANYVVTRRSLDRFKVALTGTDRLHVPPSTLTSGIAGGRTSQGDAATNVLYEEVVAVGALTKRALPGQMTPCERALLQVIYDGVGTLDQAFYELEQALWKEREQGRAPDISPGDLVVFCEQIGVKIRVRGEFQHLIPYSNVLAVVDDERLLDDAVRDGRAGVIQL